MLAFFKLFTIIKENNLYQKEVVTKVKPTQDLPLIKLG
jgi:hypothetical protein